jgi:hypothetical protein
MTKTNATMAKLSAHAGVSSAGPSAPATAAGEDGLDDEETAAPAAPDEPLVETEHILIDYLSLVPKGNLVTTSH